MGRTLYGTWRRIFDGREAMEEKQRHQHTYGEGAGTGAGGAVVPAQPPPPAPHVFDPRCCHAMVAFDGHLIVVFGATTEETFGNTVVFDLEADGIAAEGPGNSEGSAQSSGNTTTSGAVEQQRGQGGDEEEAREHAVVWASVPPCCDAGRCVDAHVTSVPGQYEPGTEAGPLERLSGAAVLYNDRIYVFGGMTRTGMLNDMVSIDARALVRYHHHRKRCARHGHPIPEGSSACLCASHAAPQWRGHAPTTEAVPAPRGLHTAVVSGDRMLVLMGQGGDAAPLHDFWAFDFRHSQWEPLPFGRLFGPPPLPVYGHSAALCGGYMYVYGGVHAGSGMGAVQRYCGDVHRYHLANGTWEAVPTAPCPAGTGPSKRPAPPPRYAMSLAACGDCLYMTGGDSQGCTVYYDDLWALDVSGPVATWAEVPLAPPPPQCRAPLPQSAAEALRTAIRIPRARSGHTAAIVEGVLYMVGGEADTAADGAHQPTFIADVYALTIARGGPRTRLSLQCARWLAEGTADQHALAIEATLSGGRAMGPLSATLLPDTCPPTAPLLPLAVRRQLVKAVAGCLPLP